MRDLCECDEGDRCTVEDIMLHFSFIEFLVVCGSIVLVAFLLSEILECSGLISCGGRHKSNIIYGYSNHNGPDTWINHFPHCGGENQSPININTCQAIVVNPSDALEWDNYTVAPYFMNITNDGHTVKVTGEWPCGLWPTLRGGPMRAHEEYEFHSMLFHWGLSDEEGSEHTLNGNGFSMELQMVHVRKGCTAPQDAIFDDAADSLVIISFLFKVVPVDNALLDHLVNNLWQISAPGSTVQIPSFPLSYVSSPFEHGYYTYSGSLTHPPCCENVIWIIKPETLPISSSELTQFRTLTSDDGPMFNNSRPVQQLNGRDVFFYD
ncbi:carbonic anhydrase 1-like [Periplaneta americana]|uniref:carbonic anhydrase 1-like n=1 Tax=Periplaneta americana TaxID=6978 RepID=UPI0037E87107